MEVVLEMRGIGEHAETRRLGSTAHNELNSNSSIRPLIGKGKPRSTALNELIKTGSVMPLQEKRKLRSTAPKDRVVIPASTEMHAVIVKNNFIGWHDNMKLTNSLTSI